MKHFYVFNNDGSVNHYQLIDGKLPIKSHVKAKPRDLFTDLLRQINPLLPNYSNQAVPHQVAFQKIPKSKGKPQNVAPASSSHIQEPDIKKQQQDHFESGRIQSNVKQNVDIPIFEDDFLSEFNVDGINIFDDIIGTFGNEDSSDFESVGFFIWK